VGGGLQESVAFLSIRGLKLKNQISQSEQNLMSSQYSSETIRESMELNVLNAYLSVMENLFLGQERTKRFGLLDDSSMAKRTRELMQTLQLEVDPGTISSRNGERRSSTPVSAAN
jgi:ABC-type sugar transport system ATPase subunit